MDAVEYLKEAVRMCEYEHNCEICPFGGLETILPCKGVSSSIEFKNPEKAVEIIEKWAAEHPKKTRQSEILKILPRAKVEDGILCYYPCDMDAREGFKEENCKRFQGSCYMCRREYWMTEVE